ncbi:MAG: hypothetical protein ACRDT6_18925 [Micromonosporaceae bacterium]
MTRHGYLARLGGAEYTASPGPAGTVRLYTDQPIPGFSEVHPGRYVRAAPETELDELRYVRTTCTWRGASCLVIGAHGGWLRLEYLGDDATVPEQLGMDRFDIAVYQGWAPEAEVTDLAEQLL